MNVYIGINSRLPSGYQEVDYIQCSGTQWIDTGYTYTNPNKVKYELSYNLTASPDNFSYFGSRVQTGTGNGYSGIPYGGAIYSNTTAFGSIAASTGTDYVLSVEFVPSSNTSTIVQYTNGTKTYDQTYTNSFYIPPTQTQNIGLFCDINGSGSAIQFASMKAYSFKIWDTDTLIRDIVPCYRKSDGVIGMYDLVNNQFYTNSGTGTFTKGADVYTNVLKNDYIGEYTGRLPSAYQEVEWIGNSGTQYIDTGVRVPNHKVIANIEYTNFGTRMPLGAYLGPDGGVPGGQVRLYGGYGNEIRNWSYGFLNDFGNYGGSVSSNTKYKLELSTISGNMYFKHDGTTYGNSSSTYSTSLAGNFGILGINSTQSWEAWNSAKVYDYKIYDNTNTLIRDFVPCYRKSDGVIGMYDLVNNQFYTNSGSGTFTKGPDVN